MGRRNYKIVIWAFLVLLLLISILYFNYWTNHGYKEGFDTFKKGDAVEIKLLVTQGTNSYETWVSGIIQSVNGNERYDVSINNGNQLLKNQSELRSPNNAQQRAPPVAPIIIVTDPPKVESAPEPAPAASTCVAYTPVSSVFDSVNNQYTNSKLDTQIENLRNQLIKNPKIIQIFTTCQNKIAPLLMMTINETTIKPILKDPISVIFNDPNITNVIAKPLTHIYFVYVLKVMEYLNNYVVKNDLSMQTLDPNYSSNIKLFVTNVNTFISGNNIPVINQLVENAFKKVFNPDKTDLNSAVIDTFVSNTPNIQNPDILLHLCTFKTPIIYTFSLDFYGFYSLKYTFLSYYKNLL
jgi:hypothetical protein